jgi:regulator of sigma E protease
VLHAIPELFRTGAAFVVVLGVLVFVHELGHYLAARWCGVHVEVFSIGFGSAIASWSDRVGTRWKLAWLPLGGYVRMHGQERPEHATPEVQAAWIPGRTFHDKPVAARAIIVAAGPIANFVLAMVLFAALFATSGRPYALATVGGVLANSAAARAGLKVDDTITAIDGMPTASFEDIQHIVVARPDQKLTLTIHRGEQTMDVPVVTESREASGHRVGILGISGGKIGYQQLSLGEAIWGGVQQTWDVTRETVVGVAQMIGGSRGTADLGGPLRIAQLSGQVAELGIASLVSFIAVLSVNLGLVNLFPIPVLDGGHLLFFGVEALRGRPIPPRAQEYGLRAGIALLASLFIFATWNDLTHLGLFHWVAKLIG